MHNKNIAIARAYYTAMGAKDLAGLAPYLHADVTFTTPLATLTGKDAVLKAAGHFMAVFNKLTIRTVFGSETQAMLVYDFEFPAPIGNLPAAVLMDIQDGLITTFQLFYDARPFVEKREEIFQK